MDLNPKLNPFRFNSLWVQSMWIQIHVDSIMCGFNFLWIQSHVDLILFCVKFQVGSILFGIIFWVNSVLVQICIGFNSILVSFLCGFNHVLVKSWLGFKSMWVHFQVGSISWFQFCMVLILCGSTPMWDQSYEGSIPYEFNPLWVHSCLGSILCGFNYVWVQSHVGSIPWEKFQMGSILCRIMFCIQFCFGLNPMWVQLH